jgi:hypothetical protein
MRHGSWNARSGGSSSSSGREHQASRFGRFRNRLLGLPASSFWFSLDNLDLSWFRWFGNGGGHGSGQTLFNRSNRSRLGSLGDRSGRRHGHITSLSSSLRWSSWAFRDSYERCSGIGSKVRSIDTGQSILGNTLASEPVHDLPCWSTRSALVLFSGGSLLSRHGIDSDDRGRGLAVRMMDLRLADCRWCRLGLGTNGRVQVTR